MRRPSIDALRGLVILLMALDHTQYFWCDQGLPDDGLGGFVPVYASAFHQFTRALSHICAPTFLFLAGMMMAGKSDRKHLAIRALLLIALQFTWENIAWWPQAYLSHGYKYFGILSCIGVSMLIILALSAPSRMKPAPILAASLLSFIVAQVLPVTLPAGNRLLQAAAIALYVPTLDPAYPLTSLFPVLHWFGFMGFGYFFGSLTQGRELSAYKLKLLPLGGMLLVTGFLLRWLNGFGNRIPWHGRLLGSSFFILSKYPPSLVYILVTLGLLFLLLAAALHFETELKSRLAQPLIIFGQASLFFYLAHLYLYGFVAYRLGHNVQVDIYRTWGTWLLGLIPLYFACDRYRKWRARKPASLLRYI